MYVLTRENRVAPGTQVLVLSSDDKKKLEEYRDENIKKEDADSGIKFTYKYLIHEVPYV